VGCTDWEAAACAATEGDSRAHQACLQYLLEINNTIDCALRKSDRLMRFAVKNRENAVNLKMLLDPPGVPWARKAADLAAFFGNANGLRLALEHGEPKCWDTCMKSAIPYLDCMEILYAYGYERWRSHDPKEHPALFAIRCAQLDSLKLVIVRTPSAPRPELIDCSLAVRGGVAMLEYVKELGGVFNEDTTATAALLGDLAALKYLHSCGAPWNVRTLEAAIDADSLECLQYALENGCPHDIDIDFKSEEELFRGMRSDALLKYVFDNMEPIWVDVALKCTFIGGFHRKLRSSVAIEALRWYSSETVSQRFSAVSRVELLRDCLLSCSSGPPEEFLGDCLSVMQCRPQGEIIRELHFSGAVRAPRRVSTVTTRTKARRPLSPTPKLPPGKPGRNQSKTFVTVLSLVLLGLVSIGFINWRRSQQTSRG
jgi:hypothetical protein